MGVNMSVRQPSGTNGKISSLLDLAEPQQCERPRPLHCARERQPWALGAGSLSRASVAHRRGDRALDRPGTRANGFPAGIAKR